MALIRWSPVRDLAAIEIDRLNHMFEAAFSGEPLAGGAWVPAIDVYETTDKDVIVKADLPALKREDIRVTFENNILSIEGERKFVSDSAQEHYHRMERGYGAFRRSFTLPPTVDEGSVNARLAEGVLTVTITKREETKPRKIKVG